MRQVPHPDKLYIQLNDLNDYKLGMAFNDTTNPVDENDTIDPNAFDQETRDRTLKVLATVYKFLKDVWDRQETVNKLDDEQ